MRLGPAHGRSLIQLKNIRLQNDFKMKQMRTMFQSLRSSLQRLQAIAVALYVASARLRGTTGSHASAHVRLQQALDAAALHADLLAVGNHLVAGAVAVDIPRDLNGGL